MSNALGLLNRICAWAAASQPTMDAHQELEAMRIAPNLSFRLVRHREPVASLNFVTALMVEIDGFQEVYPISGPMAMAALGNALLEGKPMIPAAIWASPSLVKRLQGASSGFDAMLEEEELDWRAYPTSH